MNTDSFDFFGFPFDNDNIYNDNIYDSIYNDNIYNDDQFNSFFDDVDEIILDETNSTVRKLCQDIEGLNDIFKTLSSIINNQGNLIDESEKNIEKSTIETELGTENLQVAVYENNNKLKRVRNVILVVVGGICGASGFFLGPVVGIGGVAAGITLGSAAAYGVHKKIDN